jgi:L-fucose mutarotase
MLRTTVIHPHLLEALASAGHGAKVLVADALYPHSTGAPVTAARIHLNLRPGLVGARDIVEAVAETTFLEAATYMETAEGGESTPVTEYRQSLARLDLAWKGLERFAFYEAARQPDVAAVVVSGDVRPYANLLLTIGVP